MRASASTTASSPRGHSAPGARVPSGRRMGATNRSPAFPTLISRSGTPAGLGLVAVLRGVMSLPGARRLLERWSEELFVLDVVVEGQGLAEVRLRPADGLELRVQLAEATAGAQLVADAAGVVEVDRERAAVGLSCRAVDVQLHAVLAEPGGVAEDVDLVLLGEGDGVQARVDARGHGDVL